MANNGKKLDLRDHENLIKESDEKHQKAMEEMREHNAKALEELKLLIASKAIQASKIAAPSQQQVPSGGSGILDPNVRYNGTSHYTKLEFPRFDGSRVKEWLYKAKWFFNNDYTLDGAKVKLASIYFDGKALI